MHVVFPNQKDPETGRLLDSFIKGSRVHRRAGHWQQLMCGTSEKVMEDQIRQLRWRLRPERIDVSGSYVDRVVVTCPLGPEQPCRLPWAILMSAPLIEAGTQVLSEPASMENSHEENNLQLRVTSTAGTSSLRARHRNWRISR